MRIRSHLVPPLFVEIVLGTDNLTHSYIPYRVKKNLKNTLIHAL